jgi:predicted DNA-binding transcriptional regulator AlpA
MNHDASQATLRSQPALSGDSGESIERQEMSRSFLWNPTSYKLDLVSTFGSITEAAKALGLSRSALYRALKKESMPSAICREAIARWRSVEQSEIWPNAPKARQADLEEIVSRFTTAPNASDVQALMKAAKSDIRLSASFTEGQVRLIRHVLSIYQQYLNYGVDCSIILGIEREQSAKGSAEQLRETCRKLQHEFPDNANTGTGVFRFALLDSVCLPEPLHLAIDQRVFYRVTRGQEDVAYRGYRKRSRKRPR